MDVLYIVGGVSFCDRVDLRYSLRGLHKYAKGIDRVFIVGECPYWLSDNVIKVKFVQPYKYSRSIREKHLNIMSSLLFACKNAEQLSEDFIVACDDHYLTKDVDYNDYPFFAKLCSTGTELPKIAGNEYGRELVATRQYLESHGLPTRYMTMHRNMRLKKSAVLECSDMMEEILNNKLGVEPFVLVGNYMIKNYNISVEPVEDYKIFRGSQWWMSSPEVTDCFSTTSLKYNGLQTLLDGLFDEKCIYEQ